MAMSTNQRLTALEERFRLIPVLGNRLESMQKTMEEQFNSFTKMEKTITDLVDSWKSFHKQHSACETAPTKATKNQETIVTTNTNGEAMSNAPICASMENIGLMKSKKILSEVQKQLEEPTYVSGFDTRFQSACKLLEQNEDPAPIPILKLKLQDHCATEDLVRIPSLAAITTCSLSVHGHPTPWKKQSDQGACFLLQWNSDCKVFVKMSQWAKNYRSQSVSAKPSSESKFWLFSFCGQPISPPPPPEPPPALCPLHQKVKSSSNFYHVAFKNPYFPMIPNAGYMIGRIQQGIQEFWYDLLLHRGQFPSLVCFLAECIIPTATLTSNGGPVSQNIAYHLEPCSYLQSLLRHTVIRELELGRHGLKLLKRNRSSFTPCLDGRYLLLGSDKVLNHSEISKFSKRDAEAYPRYEDQLENFCKFMEPLLDAAPPETVKGVSSFDERFKNKLQKSTFWARCMQQALTLGQENMVDFMDLLLSPASKLLNNWFEGDVLKATLATDAVIGSTASVHTPGSGYVLLHHIMGETDGDRGIWSYVEGGMGSVSLSISRAAKEAGADIITSAEVVKVLINESGAVNGVQLADGFEVHASVVLSNATPHRTFKKLIPGNVLPDDFLRKIEFSNYSSATTKINLAVDALPQFRCCKSSHQVAGPEHMGTIHIGAESMEDIDLACQDAVNGLPSRRPVIEMTIPSALDNTISPSGKHVINLFIQYTPYTPSGGSWDNAAYRESFAQRCFSLIDEYAPGFSSSIIGYDMLTPPDLEREFGLTGGNIFHGAMGLDSLFLMRPVKGWSNYKSPLPGLYLCGSGTHPGGGVMGAPGRNAAKMVLQDLKKTST